MNLLSKPSDIQTLILQDDGIIPNHPDWPVILYIGVLRENPEDVERIFNQNEWGNSWTNGVFNYHHYHSNTHEVLGIIRGSVTLQLGGKQGHTVTLKAGDVVILPAGTGHKRLESSIDFQVVGAYPKGMSYNIRIGDLTDRPQVLEEIRSVSPPETDPLYGKKGLLLELWNN